MLQEDSIATVLVDSVSALSPRPATLDSLDFAHEGYFAGSPYFHPELGVDRSGVVGEPVAYSFANDNAMMGLLLAVSLLIPLALMRGRSFAQKQLRLFLHIPHRVTEGADELSALRHFRILSLLCPVVMGATYFMYRHIYLGDTFVFDIHVATIGVFAGVSLLVLLLRWVAYNVVNWVFFSKQQRELWNQAMLFLVASFGVLLFPIVLAMVFFSVPINILEIYTLSILICVELLSIYRCYVIFFEGSAFPLQIFLYFCTLEIVPIASLWAIWDMTAGYLEINI